jgi:hypothetical protein
VQGVGGRNVNLRATRLSRAGAMSALIAAALKAAKHVGAPAVEAYPVDTVRPSGTSNVFTGPASTFEHAGFRTVARRRPSFARSCATI